MKNNRQKSRDFDVNSLMSHLQQTTDKESAQSLDVNTMLKKCGQSRGRNQLTNESMTNQKSLTNKKLGTRM